jgi:hypothetical protein
MPRMVRMVFMVRVKVSIISSRATVTRHDERAIVAILCDASSCRQLEVEEREVKLETIRIRLGFRE